ncbi:MAG: sodium:proton antiporter [Lachnospiraceae bacterium]|nr:sodium:proton antiporter [Lachnospiraceae bacterium]
MDFIKNFPFFSIMLCMFCAIITSVLGRKAAKYFTRIILGTVLCLSAAILVYTCENDGSFVYYMGHFPAPWGNEIRSGCLEAIFALFVSLVAFLSVVGGAKAVEYDIEDKKENLFYILVCLMVSSLLAMCYTNDLFTGYVFIEINTIAGCGLIMVRQIGKSVVTAIRYMVISLLGSGLFLIGVTLLYSLTGHLLMSNIQENVALLMENGDYKVQLTVVIGLMTVGLAIKSGLFPFHLWIPDAYGQSNVVSSSLLSSTVSKGYIFLLIKIYFRTIGFEVIEKSGVFYICFAFGIAAMIIGSVIALRERSFRRMIAFSSIAQIGYIFMGIGLGTKAGIAAAIFHIFAHGVTKSLLFISSSEFTEGSHSKNIDDIKGLAYKYKFSALCYSIGAFSIVGFPLLSGFISKLLLGQASITHGPMQWIALLTLAVSTILNVIYFLRTVIYLYLPLDTLKEKTKNAVTEEHLNAATGSGSCMKSPGFIFGITMLVLLNFLLGLASGPVINIINQGLDFFS